MGSVIRHNIIGSNAHGTNITMDSVLRGRSGGTTNGNHTDSRTELVMALPDSVNGPIKFMVSVKWVRNKVMNSFSHSVHHWKVFLLKAGLNTFVNKIFHTLLGISFWEMNHYILCVEPYKYQITFGH